MYVAVTRPKERGGVQLVHRYGPHDAPGGPKLKQVKNYLRSTMTQGRLVDLARLGIEAELAKKVNFDEVIRRFARKKARKAPLFSRR